MATEVRSAYAKRSGEYIEHFGTMESVDPLDAQLVATWADSLSGPVLDAGCGPGQWTDFLRRRGLDARGVDQVPEFIERARLAYPGIPFDLGSIDDVDAAPGTLVGVFTWPHLEPFDHAVVTAYRWPLEEFAERLDAAGFAVEETHERKVAGARPLGAIVARRRE